MFLGKYSLVLYVQGKDNHDKNVKLLFLHIGLTAYGEQILCNMLGVGRECAAFLWVSEKQFSVLG